MDAIILPCSSTGPKKFCAGPNSKTDRHLLGQKVRQKILVIIKNTCGFQIWCFCCLELKNAKMKYFFNVIKCVCFDH